MRLHSPTVPPFEPTFQIGKHTVGGGDCHVIAEAGSNHDRDLKKALSLVDIAADAGCAFVKFQTFVGPEIAAGPATEHTKLPGDLTKWGDHLQALYRNCALPEEFHKPLFERAQEKGIVFFSSAFSEWAVDLLYALGVPAIKIASFELVHLPLLKHAAQTGLPLIVSTGLGGLGDIERALEAIAAGNGRKVALLHCGSSYPLGAASANLRAMKTLRLAFRVPVGYSDHTEGLAVPTAATALGAALLEKHFTFGPGGLGPDHSFALHPPALAAMVKQMTEAQFALGTSAKGRMPEEGRYVDLARRSLFAARDLQPGDRLTLDAVKVVRPGVGLEPLLLEILLDRRVVRAVRADHPLEWADFLSE